MQHPRSSVNPSEINIKQTTPGNLLSNSQQFPALQTRGSKLGLVATRRGGWVLTRERHSWPFTDDKNLVYSDSYSTIKNCQNSSTRTLKIHTLYVIIPQYFKRAIKSKLLFISPSHLTSSIIYTLLLQVEHIFHIYKNRL